MASYKPMKGLKLAFYANSSMAIIGMTALLSDVLSNKKMNNLIRVITSRKKYKNSHEREYIC